MIRRVTKRVTKLPDNRGRGVEIQKDGRKNIDPNMIKLTQISASNKSGAVMRNLNKVVEKSFPKASKGLVKIGDSGIRQEIIESDSIVAKVEITTQNGSSMQAVRDTALDMLKVLIPFISIPWGRVMNANEDQNKIGKKQTNSENPTRNKSDGKT